MRSLNSSIDPILLGTRVDSAPNRNEYQESCWGKGLALKADDLTVISKPIVIKNSVA
jgi:hypothetical protein